MSPTFVGVVCRILLSKHREDRQQNVMDFGMQIAVPRLIDLDSIRLEGDYSLALAGDFAAHLRALLQLGRTGSGLKGEAALHTGRHHGRGQGYGLLAAHAVEARRPTTRWPRNCLGVTYPVAQER